MKQIVMLLFIPFSIIRSCRKECKSYTQYETAPVILEYFGDYKPGNYWIYENQNGTKRDSMWVTDYVEKIGGNELDCFKYPVREFLLHSNQLGISRQLKCAIRTENKVTTIFSCFDTLNKPLLGVSAQLTSTNLDDNTLEYNFKVNFLSSITFPKVSITKTNDPYTKTIYGSGIGLIQYIELNNSDTFSLIKYSLK